MPRNIPSDTQEMHHARSVFTCRSDALAAEGQRFINHFFTAKGEMPPRQSVDQPPIPSDTDSSDEESIIDID
jgi:hypothetical protein